MKFQKMELISGGTDFDVIRYSPFFRLSLTDSLSAAEKQSLLVTSTKLRGSRVSENL